MEPTHDSANAENAKNEQNQMVQCMQYGSSEPTEECSNTFDTVIRMRLMMKLVDHQHTATRCSRQQ